MCLYPRLIRNRKYIPNKKNGGVVPAVSDNRVLAVPVGCGKCIECMKKKKNEWKVRLNEDIKNNRNAQFVTLTFNNENYIKLFKEVNLKGYEAENKICSVAVRRFLERWRKRNKKSIRHWLVTELGKEGFEHVHLHGIIYTDKTEEIEKHWQYGYVFVGEYVNERTINYITKYVNKLDERHKYYEPRIFATKGIGKGYLKRFDSKLKKYNVKGTDETYITESGSRLALPIYYRNKIYNDNEREKLWLEKLDKEIRFCMGKEYETKTERGKELFKKAVKTARKVNKKIGYGGVKDYKEKEYEEKRRLVLQEKRVKIELFKEEIPKINPKDAF